MVQTQLIHCGKWRQSWPHYYQRRRVKFSRKGPQLCWPEILHHLSLERAEHWQRAVVWGMVRERWTSKLQGRIYIPPDGQLRHDIVKAHHDSPVTGHTGQWKTMDLVAWNFWWPGYGPLCSRVCEGWLVQSTKTFLAPPAGNLMPNFIPNHRWKVISVNLITELP